MKKTIYLNLNLDNPHDLEMYNLLESLGRNKKSIVQIALMRDGWISGGVDVPSRVLSNSNSQKAPPTKKAFQKKERPTQSKTTHTASPTFESVQVQEPVASEPSNLEEGSSYEQVHQIKPTYQPATTYAVDSGRDQQTSPDSQSATDDFPQVGQRYFTAEQIEVIKTIPNVNASFFESEGFCQVMKEELGDSSDRSEIRDAYQ